MDHWISPEERSSFKRCRRQWDLGSQYRGALEPVVPDEDLLKQAVHDALTVYYYPGMWDWPSPIVLPLVQKALLRALGEETEESEAAKLGSALLRQYIEVAPSMDDFSPVKIDHDVEGILPDPRDAERGLVDSRGERVVYLCQVDMLAVDANDAYWIVRHELGPRWRNIEDLLLDEEAVAECWAWEESYIGMEIAGTIHNELVLSGLPDASEQPQSWTELRQRGGIAQNEPSGGGRSIPQHRRLYARAGGPLGDTRVDQQTAGPLRRTKIVRSRHEITGMGRQLGVEALAMIDDDLPIYPSPDERNCPGCQFLSPCLAMTEGEDASELLASGYKKKPIQLPPTDRLGGRSTGLGRGGIPTTFG
jgi:hypothetical protein